MQKSSPTVEVNNPVTKSIHVTPNNDDDLSSECQYLLDDQLNKECDGKCVEQRMSSRSERVRQIINDGWFDYKKPIPQKQSTVMGRFYYALGAADLLVNSGKIEKNKNLSLNILSDL